MATAARLIGIDTSVTGRDTAGTASIAQYAGNIVRHEAEESVKDQVFIPSAPPPLGSDLSSDDSHKSGRNKAAKKRKCRR